MTTTNTNTKIMTMEQEIMELRNAMSGGIVSFSFAIDEKGSSAIGVRKSSEVGIDGLRDVGIHTNDSTVWLIAGDIIDATSSEKFTSVSRVFATPVSNMMVRLRGQAMVAGSIIQVDIGTYKVKFMYMLNPECGQLILE